ncbi:hypothetical protein TNCV_3270571 [Trichonephila clavipes]|nr:hypothetical protein TNCV_3270571 [Trichonephila clavipes]
MLQDQVGMSVGYLMRMIVGEIGGIPLYRFNVHRRPTRRVFSGTGIELVTKQATIRYLYHSATAATCRQSNGRNNYTGNYKNGRQGNQWFESRNRFQKDNRRYNDKGYQFRNGSQKDDFSREDHRNRSSRENFSQSDRRQRGRLNVLKGRVVVYRASTPQVFGSINGLGKIDSAFHPRYIGLINEYQACLGS